MNVNRTFALAVCTVILLTAVTCSFNIKSVEAQPKTWTVHDNGSADFSTIGEALGASSSGDTIFVFNGTYYEHLTVTKSDLAIIGENPDITIIDGGGAATSVLDIDSSDNVKVRGFKIQNGFEGIELYNSSGAVISGNIIWNNTYGVSLDNSTANTITYNRIVLNKFGGVDLWSSKDNSVVNNIVSDDDIGIGLYSGSTGNSFSKNVISHNNDVGVDFFASSGNIFYHNNFVNNTMQAFPYLSPDNVWDVGYPSGGNYWSDYNGTDADMDGIGNIDYLIASGNWDQYPLMGMFSSFNTTLGQHVNIVSNSTILDFKHFNSNTTIRIRVVNTTLSQTSGFCRLSLAHTLISPNKLWLTVDNGTIDLLFPNTELHDNNSHRWIYFAYPHSTREILVVEDNTPPKIENVHQLPPVESVYPVDSVEVYANVTDYTSGVKQVTLNYTVSNSTWFSVEMTTLEGSFYNGTIQQFPYNTSITYMITAVDNLNNTGTSKDLGYEYQYTVVPEFPSFIILTVFFLSTLLAAALHRRK